MDFYRPKLAIEFDIEKFISYVKDEKEVEDYSIFRLKNDNIESQAYEEEIKEGTCEEIDLEEEAMKEAWFNEKENELLQTIAKYTIFS